MNNQLFFGSICLTDMLEAAKKKHSAFTKGQNGKIYCSVNVWLNAEKDKFGNIMSVQLNPTKEMKDIDGRQYIGNMKQSDGPKPISDRDTNGLDVDLNDIPAAPAAAPKSDISGPTDDLPF
jgi:hypothetical protein